VYVEGGEHAQHQFWLTGRTDAQLATGVRPPGLAVIELDQDRHIAVSRLAPLAGIVVMAERLRPALVIVHPRCSI
jgi:hypothetical protein